MPWPPGSWRLAGIEAFYPADPATASALRLPE